MNARQSRTGIVKILLGCVFWSFGGLLSKFVPWSALSLAGFRSLVAVLILGACRRSFRPVNTRGTWIGAMGVSATSILFVFASKLTSAANAIVLQYAMPVFVVLYGAIFQKVRPNRLDLVTVVVVLGGVILCFFQGFQSGGMLGNALALLSAVTYAVVFLSARRPDCDALSYSFQGTLINCLLLFFIPFDAGFTTEPSHWLAAVALGVCLGCGYLFFSSGMRMGISPVTAAIVSNIEPILNPTWCFLVLGENPGVWTILGAVIVLGAVTAYSIATFRQARPADL